MNLTLKYIENNFSFCLLKFYLLNIITIIKKLLSSNNSVKLIYQVVNLPSLKA